ncbi:3-oxoadipate enol-lactone hydrolase [Longibacter salinarum]|uniref:3-oxoadipate enol-lactone hydrolase n=2 Tax=Longibacter salinarum TaxID=1850348 RepID=A0A2A8CV57_9BACT|nr:3-oxoadipate enol-lactone hydrolase [Longibacter salinarum]
MSSITVDGARLYVEEEGAGEPVILLHGLGSSARDWFKQVPHLADRYRVITLDLRGHGRSDKPEEPYSIAQFARDVAVVLRQLDAWPAHVVGLSMGGMVAMQLATDAPELVRSLVVVNSAVDVRPQTLHDVWFYLSRRFAVKLLGMRRVGKIIANKLFVRPDQEDLRSEFVERWAKNDPEAYVRTVDAIMGWTVQDRLDRVTMPALLVSSEHDYTPISEKNLAVAQMPNAELAVVDDARHALPVEKPDAFNAILDDFLQRVESDEPTRSETDEDPGPRVTAGASARNSLR